MKYAVWIAVLVLVVLHQDVWNWENKTLVFGFIPIGLFYHACISIGATIVWFCAIKFAWPVDVDFEEEPSQEAQKQEASQ